MDIKQVEQIAAQMEKDPQVDVEHAKAMNWALEQARQNEINQKRLREVATKYAEMALEQIIQYHNEDPLLIYHTEDKLKELFEAIDAQKESKSELQ